MAKDNDSNKGGGSVLAVVGNLLFGRYVSSDFFARNWLAIVFIVAIVLAYITNKYSVQTKMEEVRRLNKRLEIVETERVRARSIYMGRIRESAMQHLVDSLHLGLQIQEQPPYVLPKDK